uniref:hypothetical protein n=1 Tax=Thioalkalivibrio sp. HK1 TaxID=1469245 RepID=UPI0012DE2259
MKKIAMIAMLFGFVGAVHAAPQEATSQGGIGYQASVEPETMLAYDDSQQSDPWIGEGGAMLKPESEYDINLNTDPLCDTDPYSCFHLA